MRADEEVGLMRTEHSAVHDEGLSGLLIGEPNDDMKHSTLSSLPQSTIQQDPNTAQAAILQMYSAALLEK